jgi:tetratricopeptide (TPR) repeat protein
MKKAVVPVVFGILVGFLATYLLVRNRDMGPLLLRGVAGNTASEFDFAEERRMIDALEQRLEVNPSDLLLLTNLANLYFGIEEFPSAIGYYERALALAPNDVNLRTEMGTALFYTDRPIEALAEFERSLELEPGHPQTLFNMGVVMLESRSDTAAAIEVWERLIAMNPGYAQNSMVQEEIDRLRDLN